MGMGEIRGETELSLKECYEYAVKRSETLKIGAEEVQVIEARYRQAMAMLKPQMDGVVDLGMRLQQRNGHSWRSEGFGGAGVSAQYTIFNGFRDYYLGEVQAKSRDAREQQLLRQRQSLFMDVADLYYQIVSYDRQLEVLYELDEARGQLVEELERRLDLGKSRTSELLAARVQREGSRVEVEIIQGMRDATKELLAYLTGVSADKLRLQDPGKFPEATDLRFYLANRLNRPDLLAAYSRADSAESNIKAAEADRKPRVAVGAGVGWREETDSNLDMEVVLSVEVPLFDGGLRRGRVAETQAEFRIAELEIERVSRISDSEVRTAYVQFSSASAQMFQLRDVTGLTEENYEQQKRDYELGRSSNLDVLTGLAQWQESRRRLVATDLQARASLIQLQVAAGMVPTVQ